MQRQPIIIDTGTLQHRNTLLQTAARLFSPSQQPGAPSFFSLSLLNNKERKQGNKIARESLLCYSFSIRAPPSLFIIPFPIEVYMRIYSASLSLYLCKQYLRAPFCPRLVAERKLHPDTDKQKNMSFKGRSTLNQIPPRISFAQSLGNLI